jgi:hypothetical protein
MEGISSKNKPFWVLKLAKFVERFYLVNVFHGRVVGPSHNPQPGGAGDFFF